MSNKHQIDENVEAIRQRFGDAFPKTALVLGSGLGPYGDSVSQDAVIPYTDIPHFPQPSVEGHAGRMIIGTVEGTPLVCLQGRMHLYEGHSAQELAIPVRTLKRLGVETLILTNAAGSLDTNMSPGSLMMIEDHINLSGHNPLTGPNDFAFGVRFPDMTEAYDKELRTLLQQAAGECSVKLYSGVYAQLAGPSFETPAEIRMFGIIGANAVGMSTVPETIVARHCGIRVAAVSLITNLAAGLAGHELTHEDTIDVADSAYENVSLLLNTFIAKL